MKHRTLVLSVLVVLLVVVGLLVWRANGRIQGQHARISVSPTEQHLTVGALVDPKPTRHYRIGVLYPFLASPFWVNEAFGVQDQARKLGIDIIWLSADGYDNIDKQNSQIEDLVVQRVDALLIGATSSTGTVPAVDRAVARGVPVFAHVSSANTDKISSSVVDDDLSIGQQQAAFMGTALGGKGLVAMLNGPAAADWASRRVRGFKNVLAEKYPGIRIVVERNGVPDRADAQRLTEDLLAANPRLDGLFTVADGIAMGAADAIANAGRTKEITVTTASFSRETLPYIANGRIKLNIDENPVLMGRAAVNNVVRGLNGETVPRILYVPNPPYTAKTVLLVDPATQWAPSDWTPK